MRRRQPPFDHPHVFLDMGDDNEIICPYCSTLYRYDPSLDPHAARPPECALAESPPPPDRQNGALSRGVPRVMSSSPAPASRG